MPQSECLKCGQTFGNDLKQFLTHECHTTCHACQKTVPMADVDSRNCCSTCRAVIKKSLS